MELTLKRLQEAMGEDAAIWRVRQLQSSRKYPSLVSGPTPVRRADGRVGGASLGDPAQSGATDGQVALMTTRARRKPTRGPSRQDCLGGDKRRTPGSRLRVSYKLPGDG